MMIERNIAPYLLQAAKLFPVVTIFGPRQSGKTTLAKHMFPHHTYVNLEDVALRELAKSDPKSFFSAYPPPLVIDEVQRVPELLSTIQILADNAEDKGAFILTGSHQPKLQAEISQSLAGRSAILKLLPLSIAELNASNITLSRDEYLHKGFMPRLYRDSIPPDLYYSSYYSTYVERDVSQLIQVSNRHSFETFLKLLAGRVGQVVNLSSLAGDAGVSVSAINSWLSILEASYIIFRLPCYFNNFGKRLIKAPKIYFTEVGLASYLLGISEVSQVGRDPLLGGLFENMVVLEVWKHLVNTGATMPCLYYFRIQNRCEIDLLIDYKRSLKALEIKAGMTFDSSFAKHLHHFDKFASPVSNKMVIYSGMPECELDGVKFVNFRNLSQVLFENEKK